MSQGQEAQEGGAGGARETEGQADLKASLPLFGCQGASGWEWCGGSCLALETVLNLADLPLLKHLQ